MYFGFVRADGVLINSHSGLCTKAVDYYFPGSQLPWQLSWGQINVFFMFPSYTSFSKRTVVFLGSLELLHLLSGSWNSALFQIRLLPFCAALGKDLWIFFNVDSAVDVGGNILILAEVLNAWLLDSHWQQSSQAKFLNTKLLSLCSWMWRWILKSSTFESGCFAVLCLCSLCVCL